MPLGVWVAGAGIALGTAWMRQRGRRALACGLAFAAGGMALEVRLASAREVRLARPVMAHLEGCVLESRPRLGGVEVELGDVRRVDEGPRLPRRVLLRGHDSSREATPLRRVLPGDRLRLEARLRPPRGRSNPGLRDRGRELERRGIGALATLTHPALLVRIAERETARPLEPLRAARQRALERLLAHGQSGALLAALALGERGALPDDAWRHFRRLGLSHLLAVSGLHVGLVAGLVFGLAAALLRCSAALSRRLDGARLALVAALGAAAGYAWLAGFGVPVRRALLLLAALSASAWLRRPARPGDALQLAAGILLAFEPSALFQPGAQLSFAATAALLYAVRLRRAPGGRGLRAGLRVLDTTAIAGSATAPLVLLHFGSFAPLGLLANALVIPWIALVLLPAALSSAAVLLVAPGLELPVGAAAALARATLRALAEVAARAPAVERPPPAPLALLLAAGLAAMVLRLPHAGARVGAALGLGLALALAPARAIDPPPPRVVFLDVGQGDATLVQGREATLLVDAGTAFGSEVDLGRSVVVPALRALGVAQIDLLAVSHADLDHRGGIPSILDALAVRRVWIPRGTSSARPWRAIREAAAARGLVPEERGAGDPSARIGDLEVDVLGPPASPDLGENDRSLVLRVRVAGRTLLLPGDVEAAGEDALLASGRALRADVLKLPHHGSRSSSTRAFLEAVAAPVLVASAAWQGRFGMPHPEVCHRVARVGGSLWWTGRDGAVLVALSEPLRVVGWRVRDPQAEAGCAQGSR